MVIANACSVILEDSILHIDNCYAQDAVTVQWSGFKFKNVCELFKMCVIACPERTGLVLVVNKRKNYGI